MADQTSDEPGLGDLPRLVHELRQPLSALGLLVENAQHLDLPDDLTELVDRMSDQVTEALDVARRISRRLG